MTAEIDNMRKSDFKWGVLLRDYQFDGARWLAFAPSYMRARVLADAPGFGKTRAALAAARLRFELGHVSTSDSKCICVFTIAMAKTDWQREAAAFWPELGVTMIGDDIAAKRKGESDALRQERRAAKIVEALASPSPHLLLCSHDSAARVLDVVTGRGLLLGIVILDEAHTVKKGETIKAKTLRPLIARASRSFLLTGTPIHNRPVDLHQLLDLCCLGRFGSKWTFARKYFKIEQGKFGCRIAELLDKESLRRDVSPYMLARTVEEAYKELPARIRTLHHVSIPTTSLLRMSREKLRSMLAHAQGGVETMLREAAQKKLAAVADLAQSLAEPVVIYTYERGHAAEIVNLLAKRNVSATYATGDLVTKKRAAAIEEWKRGSTTALVCTMDAVKESATLVRAAAMIFADLDWLPGKQLQCEGRIDPARQPEGQRRPARYYYVVTENGPDEVVAERVIEKIQEMQGIVNLDSTLTGYEKMLIDAAKVESKDTSSEALLSDLVARLIARSERVESTGINESEVAE